MVQGLSDDISHEDFWKFKKLQPSTRSFTLAPLEINYRLKKSLINNIYHRSLSKKNMWIIFIIEIAAILRISITPSLQPPKLNYPIIFQILKRCEISEMLKRIQNIGRKIIISGNHTFVQNCMDLKISPLLTTKLTTDSFINFFF